MQKLYLTRKSVDKYQDEKTGTTRLTIKWIIDFSRLPQMRKLIDFLNLTMKNEDWNNIDPSFDYVDRTNNFYAYTFTTVAWVKTNKNDLYDPIIGYRLAMNKSHIKALKLYRKFIEMIADKVYQYWFDPLNAIELKIEGLINWRN